MDPLNPKVYKTIKDKQAVISMWKGFAANTGLNAENIGFHQRNEMKKAFFFGAYAMFDLVMTLSNSLHEEEVVRAFTSIREECVKEIEGFKISEG